jgi:O-methyltransferase involved in polyketide biosynthesis
MAAPDPLSLASLSSPSNVNLVRSYELDLPDVVAQKTRVIEQRLLRRRPHLTPYAPTLIAADLNDPSPFFDILFEEITKKEGLTRAGAGQGGAQSDVHTIFVCEALMIYLKAPEVLLRESARLARSIGSASLCFADRL